MLFKKFADAKAYDAPNHYGMKALRLQGFEEGGPTNFWVGLSYILPGGGAGPDTTSPEKSLYRAIRTSDRQCGRSTACIGTEGFATHWPQYRTHGA